MENTPEISYGETIRVILEVPILSGLRTDEITNADRAHAAAATVSILHDAHPFILASVGVFTDCPECGRQHRVKPFRGKVADCIFAASKGEPYVRELDALEIK